MIKEVANFLNRYDNKNTVLRYKADLTKFVDYFNIEDVKMIESITPDEWRAFVDSIKTKKSSRNAMIRSIHVFVNSLVFDEVIGSEKITKTRLEGSKSVYLKEKTKKHNPITDDELKDLLEVADEQNKVMLGILRYCGLRESEAANVMVKDIDFQKGILYIPSGKGDKPRKMGIPAYLLLMIENYVYNRSCKSEYLFVGTKGAEYGKKIAGPSINNRIKSLMRSAGFTEERINEITAHKFRHEAITDMVKAHGLEHGRQLAGHSSYNTTKRYIHDDIISDVMFNQNTVMDK